MKLFNFQIPIGASFSLFFGSLAAAEIVKHPDISSRTIDLLILLGLFSLSFYILSSGITSMLSFKNKVNETSNVSADK